MESSGYQRQPRTVGPSLTIHRQSRRAFVQVMGSSLVALAGCTSGPTSSSGSARLSARPGEPINPLEPGLLPLGFASGRDGSLLIPASYQSDVAAPLILLLHGAGGSADDGLDFRTADAEREGVLLLAVDSRGTSWDAIRGTYGPDVAFLDQALEFTFLRCRVDPSHVIVEGFSDGASYGLGLGLANGDLFTRVVALSPGFIPGFDGDPVGNPPIFVAHGKQDTILPIDETSRPLVATLRDEGYTVEFVEHEGGHYVPPAVAAEALAWSLA